MNSPIDSVLTSDAAEQYRNEKYREQHPIMILLISGKRLFEFKYYGTR